MTATIPSMKFRLPLLLLPLLLTITASAAPASEPSLDEAWRNPPLNARLRAYWWWLNGNVTKAAITRDLEEMKAKGFGGALICDAGGAEQDGNDRVPHGPTFFTPGVARALQARPARGRPARPGDEPEHPERLESRRPDGQSRGRRQEAGLVGDARRPARRSSTQACRSPRAATSSTATVAVRGLSRFGQRTVAWPADRVSRSRTGQQKALHKPLHFSAPDTAPLFAGVARRAGRGGHARRQTCST